MPCTALGLGTEKELGQEDGCSIITSSTDLLGLLWVTQIKLFLVLFSSHLFTIFGKIRTPVPKMWGQQRYIAMWGNGSATESERGCQRYWLVGAFARSEVHRPLFNKHFDFFFFEFLRIFLDYMFSCWVQTLRRSFLLKFGIVDHSCCPFAVPRR